MLIAEGDDAQRRLAIAHGFEATDPLIRLEAIRGIFYAEPRLIFRLTPEADQVNKNYKNAMKAFSGDFETENVTSLEKLQPSDLIERRRSPC